jgi:hypothetical protein
MTHHYFSISQNVDKEILDSLIKYMNLAAVIDNLNYFVLLLLKTETVFHLALAPIQIAIERRVVT